MTKIVSGGGYTSNKLVQSQKWKQEPRAKAVSVPAVAALGRSEQYRKPPLEQGAGYSTKPQGSTGVPGKYNAATSGPGSGRTIYKSGGQSLYGPVNPGIGKGAPRDILSEFGPEKSKG
jgi:hypothetical protein